MADHSGIEWTDATWNPVTGCTKVSPGCDHCYAERIDERFHGKGSFAVVRRSEGKLYLPLKWRKPRRVFVNSMSDLFHDDVPDSFIARVFAVMAQTPQHTYQVLTKRHGRMRSLLNNYRWWTGVVATALEEHGTSMPTQTLADGRCALSNVWLGVSIENQQWADIRIPALLETPAAVRWLSCEPLLGPVDLSRWLSPRPGWGPEYAEPSSPTGLLVQDLVTSPGLDWVVVGGESGPGARPMHPDWARSLRDQCVAAGVPFFFKQWGEYGELPRRLGNGQYAMADPGVTVANDGTVYLAGELYYPDGSRYGEAIRARHDKARLHAMYRVGKRAAGRELDGRTWDEYPAVAHA